MVNGTGFKNSLGAPEPLKHGVRHGREERRGGEGAEEPTDALV